MNNYYTYAYLRQDGTPYYIGKGTGQRINSPNHTVGLPETGKRIYLKLNLTEEQAYAHEAYLIAVLGRKDIGTGMLWNRTDGGETPGKGRKWTDAQKKTRSEAMRGTNNHRWNGGKKKKKVLTEEERWEIHDRRVMSREKNRQKSSGRFTK